MNGSSYWGLIEQNIWHSDRLVLALSNTRAKTHFLVWMSSEFPLPQLATDSGWASQHLDWGSAICVLFRCHDSSLRAACWAARLYCVLVFWCFCIILIPRERLHSCLMSVMHFSPSMSYTEIGCTHFSWPHCFIYCGTIKEWWHNVFCGYQVTSVLFEGERTVSHRINNRLS